MQEINLDQYKHPNHSELTSYWQLQLEGPSPSSILCNCHYVQGEPGADVGAGLEGPYTQQVLLE
jgi:hypothetical protein